MLVAAAAQKWGVDPSACRAASGVVQGPGGRRRATASSRRPPPGYPSHGREAEGPQASRYVRQAVNRLDSPAKIDGTAEYGIDVKLPGMLYASLAQCPVIGGKVRASTPRGRRPCPG